MSNHLKMTCYDNHDANSIVIIFTNILVLHPQKMQNQINLFQIH